MSESISRDELLDALGSLLEQAICNSNVQKQIVDTKLKQAMIRAIAQLMRTEELSRFLVNNRLYNFNHSDAESIKCINNRLMKIHAELSSLEAYFGIKFEDIMTEGLDTV